MHYKIGIDGGGTKTECILVDEKGTVVAVHVGAGCNPSTTPIETAKSIVMAALESLRAQSGGAAGVTRAPFQQPPPIESTLLCMAGSRTFWKEFAAGLKGFGKVVAADDSLPVLEQATNGRAGLVLHSGTGSFVAARGPQGSIHYAGGLGWRFGDPGSGYDIGRRAISRTLLELQGWAPVSKLTDFVCTESGCDDAAAITHFYYSESNATAKIAALSPGVLKLVATGDMAALQVAVSSAGELLDLAVGVAEKIFTESALPDIQAGLSGPILTQPAIMAALNTRAPFALAPVDGTPIEGVRRLLAALKT